MRLKILVGALVFLIVLNLATIGTLIYMHFDRPAAPEFFPPGSPTEGERAPRAPHLRRLPPERRQQLVGLLRELRAETSELRERNNRLEDQAFHLMQLDPVPAARVDSLLREISAARLEISRIAARKLVETKSVLPPEEQRLFFDAILEARPVPRFPHGPGQAERPTEGRRRRARPDSL